MSRPTLRDVAARAGLSVTQVSRALNDHSDVAESTKELARQVARELRYTPNLEARRLKDPAARTGSVGIILPNDGLRFSDPFFGDLLSAMVAEAAGNGLQLVLSTPPPGTAAIAPYDLAIRRKQVDGFVLLRTVLSDPRIELLLNEGVPFVAFGRPPGTTGFPAIELAPNCFAPVVDHLTSLGHQHVACVAEPAPFAVGQARLAAFREAMANHDLPLDNTQVIEAGFHERSGYDAASALLEHSPRPTAIVAMNDLLALGALEAAVAQGLSVPADLSVIGFDDVRAARQVRPSLTTLRLAASEVGAALIRELLPDIESGQPSHRAHRVQTELVIRESTGPVPIEASP